MVTNVAEIWFRGWDGWEYEFIMWQDGEPRWSPSRPADFIGPVRVGIRRANGRIQWDR